MDRDRQGKGLEGRTLARRLALPFANLEKGEIATGLIGLIPSALARRLKVIPVTNLAGALVVAMSWLDLAALDELRLLLDRDVRPAIAEAAQIERALERYYPALE